jgi:hypothetical protein
MKEYEEVWPQRLKEVASAFTYPPTPDVAAEVRRRLAGRAVHPPPAVMLWHPRMRWAWLVAAVLLALAGLILVPQVRAAVRDFLQIGAVRIFEQPLPEQPAAAGTPTLASEPAPARETLLALAAETTLAGAQADVDFALLLPTHPADLGRPDQVFVQPVPGGQAVIMIWLEPHSPGDVKLALYQIRAPAYAGKYPATMHETAVNGHRAVWLEGGHLLHLAGMVQAPLVVEGNVLVWSAGDVTYRLESALPPVEAVRIAESLAVLSEPAPDGGFENCPVTLTPDSPFTPPEPYPPDNPYTGRFWYGTEALWVSLPTTGGWPQLAYGDKLFWWRDGYNGSEEQRPELAVTARRLDAPAPVVKRGAPATNAYHPDFHWAMLTGLSALTPGCWEITGDYQGHQLSFVVWVAP